MRRLLRHGQCLRRFASSGQESTEAFVEKLSAKEFEELALYCGKRLSRENPLDMERILQKADKNYDGVIDLAELSSFWRRQGPHMLVRSAAAAAEPPTGQQLRRLAVISSIPCLVFGFLDNSIMLVAGDAIDSTLGVKFGLSAMACAAFGNVIADVTGQLSGGTVDGVLRPFLPNPKLTPKQQASRAVRVTNALASTLGIFVGCLAGCAPLLFINSASNDSSRDEDDDSMPKIDVVTQTPEGS